MSRLDWHPHYQGEDCCGTEERLDKALLARIAELEGWVRHLADYRHRVAGNHEPGAIESCRDSECYAIRRLLGDAR